jgi:microcystin-dependent protein
MALPVRKGYKGAPAQAVLTNSPTSGDTSFVVDSVTGWATTFPFYCVVEPGTSKEEKVKVTAISTLTLTVVRAQDDTSASGHNAGAAIYPVFTADEADEANQIASVMTTKGDVIGTDGSSINRLGIGTNTHVLQADSTATNGFKWGQIVEAGIADSAVTSAKIANSTIVLGDLAAALQAFLVPVGTINAYPGATAPTGWLLCNGTSTSGYTALAALVGATTPDLQGHTLVGKSASAPFNGALLSKFGSTTSTAPHTHAIGSIGMAEGGAHTHAVSETPHGHEVHRTNVELASGSSGSFAVPSQNSGTSVGSTQGSLTGISVAATNSSHSHTITGDTGVSSAAATHGNVQPSALVNFIIKHD